MAAALKPLLAEAGKNEGSAFERDSAVVLRRIEEATRDVQRLDPSNRRAFVDLVGRLTRQRDEHPPVGGAASQDPDPPRLIVP